MSDELELKLRIADVIFHELGDKHGAFCIRAAQAVIDDLGLEREGAPRGDAKRWVSKWELL